MASSSSSSTSTGNRGGITLQKYRGTLSLLGQGIDDIALANISEAQAHAHNHNPIKPPHAYHITFLTKVELRGLTPEKAKLVAALLNSQSQDSPNPISSRSNTHSLSPVKPNLDTEHIFSLGIGSSSIVSISNKTSVFWTVIIWPAGQQLRKLLSLPAKHFHITLSETDVHHHDDAEGVGCVPVDKGVNSLLTALDFSSLSSPSTPTPVDLNTLTLTKLDHLTYTLQIFHSYIDAQVCSVRLILQDGESMSRLKMNSKTKTSGYKGFLRFSDACFGAGKFKLAMLGYGCVWEITEEEDRDDEGNDEAITVHGETETYVNVNDKGGIHTGDKTKPEKTSKLQSYVLKKLVECALHTEWGHVFREDEVADINALSQLLYRDSKGEDEEQDGHAQKEGMDVEDVRRSLLKPWSEGLRDVVSELGPARSKGISLKLDANANVNTIETEISNANATQNNPREILYIPINASNSKRTGIRTTVTFYRLPRFFTWLVPFHLALMSTPKSRADVRALASRALGIRCVLTLTEEERLDRTWFVDGKDDANYDCDHGKEAGEGGEVKGKETKRVGRKIVNTFMPVPNERPPSIEQMDCVIRLFLEEEEDNDEEEEYLRGRRKRRKRRNTPMLIHCGGGKGRAGTVAACYLVSFGFSKLPPSLVLSQSASKIYHSNDDDHKYETPALTSHSAISSLRVLRPGSLETRVQEAFVSEWASRIWKRRSVFPPAGEEEPHSIALVGSGGALETEGALHAIGQNGAPILVMLVGLPGSGKSWFARALMARDPGGWIYVSQDDVRAAGFGSTRDVCEREVARGPTGGGRGAGRGRRGVILDRCNTTRKERTGWLDLSRHWTCPSSSKNNTLAIHFSYSATLCLSRAQRRISHPTLPPGGRVRAAIKSMDSTFEAPEVKEGFTAVVKVGSFRGAGEGVVLVDGLGGMGSGGGRGGAGGRLIKFPRTPHLMDLGAVGGDDVWVEGGVDGFVGEAGYAPSGPSSGSGPPASAIPVTGAVVVDSGKAGAEMSALDSLRAQHPRPQVHIQKSNSKHKIIITEKIDGANMGISLSPDGSQLVVQNRSHYISSDTHVQFRKLDAWLERREAGLRKVLYPPGDEDVDGEEEGDSEGMMERRRDLYFADRYILYGEWMCARHSVGYDQLEDWFVAFDLYDRVGGPERRGGFVDSEILRRRCGAAGIACTPVLYSSSKLVAGEINVGEDGEMPTEAELVRLVHGKSVWSTHERREGVYVKIEQDGWVKSRGKIVRGDFIAGNEHWTRGEVVRNRLKDGLRDTGEW